MANKQQLRDRWLVEPGSTIRRKVCDFKRGLPVSHGRNSDELFCLLENLPYRDEVPSGKDFRGSDFAGGREFDFSNADFTYSTSASDFFACDLRGAKFDDVKAERSSFRTFLDGASFRKAKLRSCYMSESVARNCCFDAAKLSGTDFGASDVSGSSFRGANCKMATFAGADIRGCDFRGACLHEASFIGAKIDKSTDFRGASLINAYHDDRYDNAGNLIGQGVDLRQATYDDTTEFGKDALAFPLEVNQRAIEIATRDYGTDGARLAEFVKQSTNHMIAEGKRSLDWENAHLAQLNPHDREIYEQIMDDTYKSLL